MSETFKIWLKYCDMIFLLLNFVTAERNSDWSVHLETFAEMLVFDRAQDHCKYMNLDLVFLYMCELPEKHLDLQQNFIKDFPTASRNKTASTFNCVSADMALKQVIQCLFLFIDLKS